MMAILVKHRILKTIEGIKDIPVIYRWLSVFVKNTILQKRI